MKKIETKKSHTTVPLMSPIRSTHQEELHVPVGNVFTTFFTFFLFSWHTISPLFFRAPPHQSLCIDHFCERSKKEKEVVLHDLT
jgi:hypothetical protein